MRRRCSLCGGKLNGNICTECGLDNSKNDDQYVTLGNSGHEESLNIYIRKRKSRMKERP